MPLTEITAVDERRLGDLADVLAGSRRILIITGAGISTSVGIPDFRSKDGLYNMTPDQTFLPTPPPSNPCTPSSRKRKADAIEADTPPSSQSSTSSRRSSAAPVNRLRGQDLFNASVLKSAESTTQFFQFIASLRQRIRDDVKGTSATHKFVRTLRDGGRLMRCYTQNIDGLEAREGLCMDLTRGKGNKRRFMKKHYETPLPAETQGTDFDAGCEVVQLHGDLKNLRCNVCAAQVDWTAEETEIFLEGFAPKCEICSIKSDQRLATGKRGLSVGSLRPNIVLYGEEHPQNTLLMPFVPFDTTCQPEVLIIMGTSLKVFGLQKIVREFAKAIHARKDGRGRVIFVNRTRPAESVWDGIIDDFVSMDCDEWIESLKSHRPDLWLRQGEIDLKMTKPASTKRKRKDDNVEESIEGQPQKKAKFTIEIPGSIEKLVPPKRRKPAVKKVPSTPRHKKQSISSINRLTSIHTDQSMPPTPSQARRPIPSPLTNSFKPLVATEAGGAGIPGSPRTPTYSPITPRYIPFTMSRLRQEITPDITTDGEIEENLEEQENTDSGLPGTPSTVHFHDRSLFSNGAAEEAKSQQLHYQTSPKAITAIKQTNKSPLKKRRSSQGFMNSLIGETDLLGSNPEPVM